MIAKKEIMVLGSGISGIGSVMLAKKMDIDVFLSEGNIIDEDTKKTLLNEHIDFEENGHDPKKLIESDEIIISPGISFNKFCLLYTSTLPTTNRV